MTKDLREKEYSNNLELQKQFDYVFINDYTEEAKELFLSYKYKELLHNEI